MLSFADPNYQVRTVSGAEEALSLIKRKTFNLSVLDYGLPRISGIELCREIRRIGCRTPMMFFSAMTRERGKNDVAGASATEHLVKPSGEEFKRGGAFQEINPRATSIRISRRSVRRLCVIGCIRPSSDYPDGC